MSWSAPTTADVLSEFTPQESAGLNNLQSASNLAAIFARAVAEVRDAIRAGGYALDADATKIPLGLHSDCIALARWRWLISIPSAKAMQTDPRKAAFDGALTKLDKISNQQWTVEPPTTTAAAGSWNSENKLVGRMHPVPRPSTQSPATGSPPPYANPSAPTDA